MTISKLAERIGVTQRTLRHWEKEELLPPPSRGANGYRTYRREHLLLLLQIKALRQLGLSIPEIKNCLATNSPREVVELHVRQTRRRVALQERVCRKLEALSAHLDDADSEAFLQAIEEVNSLEQLPPDLARQADRLDELRRELGAHPIVLIRGISGLEDHLNSLPEVLLPSHQKQALLSKARELTDLSSALGREKAIRAKALEMAQQRLGTDSPEATLAMLAEHRRPDCP